jgi:hypothetical protein
MIDIIRDQAFVAIEKLTPPQTSFVLTNCLLETDPMDRAAYDEVDSLAARRGNIFVPVVMRASDAAHAARVPTPDRAERLKHTDVESAAHKRRNTDLLRVSHPNFLDIETTDLPPAAAAAKIIAFAEGLAK